MKSLPFDPSVYYAGPDIDEGPRSSFFYFALSAKDSLTTAPYNHPVTFLKDSPIRIFTVTIPEHEEGKKPQDAIERWADSMKKGSDILTPFFHKTGESIRQLLKRGLILPEKIAVGGLSRGAFVACHIASMFSEIRFVLGFAPLTELTFCQEFSGIKERIEVKNLNLIQLKENLSTKHIRFYIGNRDMRVGTTRCFSLIMQLAETAYEKNLRTSPIEMIMGPSIGYLGHGTSPDVFKSGTKWLQEKLADG